MPSAFSSSSPSRRRGRGPPTGLQDNLLAVIADTADEPIDLAAWIPAPPSVRDRPPSRAEPSVRAHDGWLPLPGGPMASCRPRSEPCSRSCGSIQHDVVGTGRDGRVTRNDVLAAAANPHAAGGPRPRRGAGGHGRARRRRGQPPPP